MARDLLLRGMLAGVIAALLAGFFARIFAEPQVDLAIAFEAAHHVMHHHAADAAMTMTQAPEARLVSRATQKGLGLFVAMGLYGAAVGGIFALVFALAYGRIATMGPRSLALLLAVAAFLTIALVPAIKYPATPPAVGKHETVALRTMAYFAMTGFSVVGLLIALKIRAGLVARLGSFNAALAGAGAFILIIIVLQATLPMINEVPKDFPAVVLW
ncbi:MAG: CbtA family protein, partial [Sphingobium sp.]